MNIVILAKGELLQENSKKQQPKIPYVPPGGEAVFSYDTDWQYGNQTPEGDEHDDSKGKTSGIILDIS